MSDNKELLPCPFCGSDDLHSTGNGVYSSYIECNGCGASGPAADHADNEQALWNRRAAQPVVLTDEDKLFQIIRSFGYTTKGQTDEIVAAILAAKEQA